MSIELIIKSIVYRLFRIIILGLIVYITTKNITISTLISIIDVIVATLYYYLFEIT